MARYSSRSVRASSFVAAPPNGLASSSGPNGVVLPLTIAAMLCCCSLVGFTGAAACASYWPLGASWPACWPAGGISGRTAVAFVPLASSF